MDGAAGSTAGLRSGPVVPEDIWGSLCIFAEARGEPYEGQIAVGNVLRNRATRKPPFFSDGSIVGTVWAPHQFSWTNTDDPQRRRVLAARWEEKAFQLAAQAWADSAHRQIVPREVLWYHADYVSPWWAKQLVHVSTVGRHLFYREADTV